jgi:hypothetical protein
MGLQFGEAIALYKGVTHKEQAQREAIVSPFGSPPASHLCQIP